MTFPPTLSRSGPAPTTASPARPFAGLALLCATAAVIAAFASPSSARVEPHAWPGLRADQLFAFVDEAGALDALKARATTAPATVAPSAIRLGNLAWTGADRAPAGYRLGPAPGGTPLGDAASERLALASARAD